MLKFERYGFRFDLGGAHLARTIMLGELTLLLEHVTTPTAARDDYVRSVVEKNILGKRSGRTRQLTLRYLTRLYALDPSITLFRALRYYWARDEDGHPLLSFLCAYGRDAILRLSAPLIFNTKEGRLVDREDIEAFLDDHEPGRFSSATLGSTARNIRSSWTQSGHLVGKVKKRRIRANATPGAAAYALLLGYLRGARGENLFDSEYARLLDCPPGRISELATEASQRGWMIFKQVGRVIEVAFPNLLTEREMGWIRESN